MGIFTYYGHPVLNADAYNFVTTSVCLKYGGELTNPLFKLAAHTDPSGQMRHMHYPPLFSCAVAALMWGKQSYISVYWALYIINVLNICLFALVLYKVYLASKYPIALAAAAIVLLCVYLLSFLGRPEALALCMLWAGIILYLYNINIFYWTSGILLSMIMYTGIVPFVYGLLMYMMACAANKVTKSTLIISIFVFLCTSVCIALLLPYPITDFIYGIAKHIYMIQAGPCTWSRFVFYHLLNKSIIGYFVLLLFFYYHIIKSWKGNIYTSAICILFILVNIISFRAMGGVYNTYFILPILLIYYLSTYKNNDISHKVGIAAVVMATAGYMKQIVYFVLYIGFGTSIHDAYTSINSINISSNCKGIDPRLFLFFNNYNNIYNIKVLNKNACSPKIYFNHERNATINNVRIDVPSYEVYVTE
ncbi:MAG: hypothetical protein NW207_06900 [Cytophagales bacterium]|nr:hypothetical protein [Cytophagales bacterium]